MIVWLVVVVYYYLLGVRVREGGRHDGVAAVQEPGRPFLNFRASRSGDRQILSSSGTPCDRF